MYIPAVTKRGTGTWNMGPRGRETRGRGMQGLGGTETRGRKNAGTWDAKTLGLEDAGTRGLEDVINKHLIFALNL